MNTKLLTAIRTGLVTVASYETVFALFIYSGLFKAYPSLSRLPIDLTAILMLITLVYGGWIIVRRGFKWRITNLVAGYLAAAFFVYMIATILWSPDTDAIAYKAVVMIPLVAFSFVSAALVIAPEPLRVRRFLLVSVGLAVAMLPITFAAYQQRLPGTGLDFSSGEYIAVGRLLGVAWIVLYVDLITRVRRWSQNACRVALLTALGVGLFIVGARQALVGVALVALLPILDPKLIGATSRRSAKRVRYVSIAVIAAGLFLALTLRGLDYDLATLDRLVLFLTGQSASVDIRQDYRAFVQSMWPNHPIVGHGLGAFGILSGATPPYRAYPHNVILELLMEGGLVAVVLFLTLVGWCAITYIRAHWRTDLGFASTCVVLLVLFAGLSIMVSSTYSEERWFFSLLGLMCLTPSPSSVHTAVEQVTRRGAERG